MLTDTDRKAFEDLKHSATVSREWENAWLYARDTINILREQNVTLNAHVELLKEAQDRG